MGNSRMSDSPWKYAFASVIGTGHMKANLPCQDQSCCCLLPSETKSDVLVAVVSDGAGSASHSQMGAEIACSETIAELTDYFDNGESTDDISQNFANGCLLRIQNKIALNADAEGLKPRDFACTWLVAIVGTGRAIFWQVGDGAIVYSEPDAPDDYGVVYWPEKGEYENMTVFATQPDASEHLQFSSTRKYMDEVALITDGIQRLALDFSERNAHSPFFHGMFSPLRVQNAGHSTRASLALTAFLSSSKVNERTDDDKTLLLASRRFATPLAASPDQEINANHNGTDSL
jgi:hypothetical protein